jgi:hypothetical protein
MDHAGTNGDFIDTLVGSVALVVLFTALSGLADAYGFVHASRVWQDGRFAWLEALKCCAGFMGGMLMYWIALWKLSSHGIVAAEVQTLFCFTATIVGVAVLSGRVMNWPIADLAVATVVLAGVGWLLYRGAH